MKVLWVTSNLPDPALGGGAAHEFELLRWTAQRHEVTLLAGGLPPGSPVPSAIAALGLRTIAGFHRPHPRRPSRPMALLQSLVGNAPYEFRMLERRVQALLEESRAHQPDLVQVMWAETAPVACDSVRRCPTAFFASDAFSRHEERELSAATTLRRRLFRWLELHQTLRWERTYLRAGAVGVASPLDAAALGRQGIDSMVVPSALGDDWFDAPSLARDGSLVSFVAALDYGPNRDAVDWLLADIWPRIRSEIPECRLRIAGRNPGDDLRSAVESAGGELCADLPDIRPAYWETAVALMPIRLGSGMRNKVLHAAACRAPIVATSAAVEGIPLDRVSQVRVADDAAGLATAVCDLLRDPAAALAMAARAQVIAEQYRIERVGPLLEELWRRARVGWPE